jgi:O-antigen/teichoic acid export membrane protein
MRIYILGLIVLVVELASVMLLLRQGRFSVRLSMVVLAVSVAVSWLAAHTAGLAGAAAGSVTAIYLDHAATLWRISRCTGIPVRRLQDWRSLALLLLCAALAGLLSWWVVHRFVAGFGPEVRIAAGAVVLATGYFTLVALGGLGRHWRAALEGRS